MVNYFLLIFSNDEFEQKYNKDSEFIFWTVRNHMVKADFKLGDIVYIRKYEKGMMRVVCKATISSISLDDKTLILSDIKLTYCTIYKGETLYESLKFNRGASYKSIDFSVANKIDQFFS